MDYRVIHLITIAVYFAPGTVYSAIVVSPGDTVAMVNQTTYLNCTTSVLTQGVSWNHYSVGVFWDRETVFHFGFIAKKYEGRFRIEGNSTNGEYHLVIENVQREDAGKYECQDSEGLGEKRSAQLIVLEEILDCQSDANEAGIVGPNACGIEPDHVQLSCRASFHGNIEPKLELRIERNNETRTLNGSHCQTSGGNVTCAQTVTADQMSEASYICQVQGMTTAEWNDEVSCELSDFNVKYVFGKNNTQVAKIGDEVTCEADTNQQCEYKWTLFENGESVKMFDNSVFTPDQGGWYKCEAECSLGQQTCSVTPLTVRVAATNGGSQEATDIGSSYQTITLILAAAVVALAAILVLIICVFVIIRCRKAFKKTREMEIEAKSNHPSLHVALMPNITEKVQVQQLEMKLENNQKMWSRERNEMQERIEALKFRHDEDLNVIESLKEELRGNRVALKKSNSQRSLRERGGPDSAQINELKEAFQLETQNWNDERAKLQGQLKNLERILYQTRPASIEYNPNPVPVQELRTDAADNRVYLPVSGLALLNSELFVVSRKISEIKVYDSSTLNFKRSWELEDLDDPWDIAACSHNRCIYILDWKNDSNVIFRVNANGSVELTWSVGDGGGFLSVTREEANVVLVVSEQSLLMEYSAKGQLVKEISFPRSSGIIHPLHAIKLTTGHYVVSHGQGNDTMHRVCVVSDKGEVIKSFGGRKGSAMGHINTPMYMATDRDDTIFISDYSNRRLLLLSSTLDFKRELTGENFDLRFGERLCLNEANGQLFVADNDQNATQKQHKQPRNHRILALKLR